MVFVIWIIKIKAQSYLYLHGYVLGPPHLSNLVHFSTSNHINLNYGKTGIFSRLSYSRRPWSIHQRLVRKANNKALNEKCAGHSNFFFRFFQLETWNFCWKRGFRLTGLWVCQPNARFHRHFMTRFDKTIIIHQSKTWCF